MMGAILKGGIIWIVIGIHYEHKTQHGKHPR